MTKSKFSKVIALAIAASMVLTVSSVALSTSTSVYAEEISAIETEFVPEIISTLDGVSGQAATASLSDYGEYFDGGDGTENSPFEIATADQLQNIGKCSNLMASTYVYYVLTDDIYLSELSNGYANGSTNYITNYFNGELDGDYYSIEAADNCYIWLALYTVDNPTFEHLNINQTAGMFGLVVYSGFYYTYDIDNRGINFDYVHMYGIKSIDMTNNDSAFVCIGSKSLYFYDCYNKVPWNMTGYGGVFLGGYAYDAYITYEKCVNDGNITGVYVGLFNGNTNSSDNAINIVENKDFSDAVSGYCNVYMSECVNYATLTGTSGCGPFAINDSATLNKDLNTSLINNEFEGFTNRGFFLNENVLSTVNIGVSNNNVTFNSTSTISDVDHYVISVYTSVTLVDWGSSYVQIDIPVNSAYLSDVTCHYYSKIIGSNEYGTAYSAITEYITSGTENYVGASYKVVADGDGSYIIVVDSDSLVSANLYVYADLSEAICNADTIYYRLTAYDSTNNILGAMTYSL